MLTVTLNNPSRPPGTKLAVRGLGVMVNGQSRQLTVEEEKSYNDTTGKNVVDLNGKNGFSVEGTSEYIIVSRGTIEPNEPPTPVVPFIPQQETPVEEREVTS